MNSRRTAGPCLLSCVILSASVLLQGCATLSVGAIGGTVTTKDRKPLLLSSPGQTLLIEPGTLSILIKRSGLFEPLHLVILTGRGELDLELHRGEVRDTEIRIQGVTHGLSANIIGNGTEVVLRSFDRESITSCTTFGYCGKSVEVRECGDDKKCRTRYEWQYGYHADCPGHQPETLHMQDYKIDYAIAFLNPMNTRDELARFKGETEASVRQVGSTRHGFCAPD